MCIKLGDGQGFSCSLGSEGKGGKGSSGWRVMKCTKVSVLKKIAISHEQRASCGKRETFLTKQV